MARRGRARHARVGGRIVSLLEVCWTTVLEGSPACIAKLTVAMLAGESIESALSRNADAVRALDAVMSDIGYQQGVVVTRSQREVALA